MKIFNGLKEKARSAGNSIVEKSKDGLREIDKIKKRDEKESFMNDDFYDNDKPIDLEDMDGNKDIDVDKDIEPNRRDYDIGLPPTQKPASFHHFLLENQYQDLEMHIRGYKNVKDKKSQTWKTVRKERHCFTDEEAENLVRLAQSHLSPDIKLGILHPDAYKITMQDIGSRLMQHVRSLMHYYFGRFKESDQLKMKDEALNILQALMQRIKMNYSRAVKGGENIRTHDSVRGQESLQGETQKDRDYSY